ncbi:MAG: DUF1211 domain-containing protein [Actinobacteria bacterium]|nr:DUF1211 domain-containing protein [Actinomycetota bacterium]
MNKSRLEAFSDGVFAVAITLLALDLAVKGPDSPHPLAWQLGHAWPSYVAYLISFLTIGIIWVNHHATMNNVRVVNRTLLYLNLVLLAVVVAIPFATSTMAEYLSKDNYSARVAAALYASVFEAMGLAFALLFEWILRHDNALHDPMPAAVKNRARLRFYGGQILYVIAIAVAFLNAQVAVGLCAVTAFYYLFERSGPVPGLDDG